MAGIDLESLGITKDDLQERIVESAVDRLMNDRTEDEDGRSYINKSTLQRELEKHIVAHVNERIGQLAAEHVLPRVTEIVDGLTSGDLIVAKAGAFVRDGDRVMPVEETDSGTVAAITE